MKKIILISTLLHLTFTLLAKNETDSVGIGKYVVTFYTTYTERHYNVLTSTIINSSLCLNSDMNSTSCNAEDYDDTEDTEYHCYTSCRMSESTLDTCQVPSKLTHCNVFTWTAPTFEYSNFIQNVHVSPNYKVKQLSLSPNSYNLGEDIVYGHILNSYNPDVSQKLFKVSYKLEIRPLEVICETSNDRELLYEDTICIKATKGFPKETYKWRYSYKDAQGKPKKGVFTPFKTEDNGATIYVKGSDFLSESQFNQLVETQEGITISPDGADGYYKPLSFESVNLTAKPLAPKFENVKPNKPACNKDSASLEVMFNRAILENEYIVVQYKSLTSNQRHEDIINTKGIKIFNSKNLASGSWKVIILHARYKNKKGQYVNSHSVAEGMQDTITITAPDPVTINNISQTTTSCIGRSDGTISCEVNGGTGEKICSLNNYDDKSTYNGRFLDGTFVFTGIPKGSY